MQENFESTNKENIQMNIKVRKFEPIIQSDTTKTKSLIKNKSQTKEIKWQVLKPEDLEFGNLPIQKLLPVPFVNCIESFSRIEGSDNLIFIDVKMKKKWIDFLIDRIQNSDKNRDNLMSNENQNQTQLNIDISEIENKKIYNIYTFTNNFRFIFSDKYSHATIICGVEYLSKHNGASNVVISQKDIKKGLLNYIFKKWIN
jgi:hypothetical protein